LLIASKERVINLGSNIIDTITDEDRLPHYKLFASRFEGEA